MPLRCPACQTQIRHHDSDEPRPREQYRCHVCRLTLMLDERDNSLVVAPFEIDHRVAPTDAKERATTIPLPTTPRAKPKSKRPRT